MRTLALLVAVVIGVARSVSAEPITLPTALSKTAVVIDFEGIATGGKLVTPIPGALTIGDVTFTSLTGNLSILDLDVAGWAANGTEVSGNTLFPGGEPDSAIVIDFARPVSEFLLGWGDPNFSENVLLAYNPGGKLLETASVTLGPSGGTHAAWIGFRRVPRDIARIIVRPDQSMASGDDYVIDNIHYTPRPLPEPASVVLMLHGLIALAIGSRRRGWKPTTLGR